MLHRHGWKTDRRIWLGVIALLAVAYAAVTRVTRHPLSNGQPGMNNGAEPMSAGQVPAAVQAEVLSRVGSLVGPNEIVFFPLSGDHVGVYATVNLGYGTEPLTAGELDTVRADTAAWFQDLYSGPSGSVIDDAEIYFVKDGRAVAGSGLGIDAYRSLLQSVSSVGSSGLVSALKQGQQVSGEGVNESWFETAAGLG